MKYILMVILLCVPISAQADWSDTGMHLVAAPNLNLTQRQITTPHPARVNVVPIARVEPTHHEQPAQPVHPARLASQVQVIRHDQPMDHRQEQVRHMPAMPDYFRHDVNYYGHVDVVFPYSDVDAAFAEPDGFEVVMVNGETFYYNQGVFYQQVGHQLTAIPAVLGAVVDSIPEDYQIVMADGVHYLFTGGIYYQRVDRGFEVVEGPNVASP